MIDAYWHLGDLYFDLNNPGQSASSWETAVKLGEDLEKNVGKAPAWLTDTYYRLGQVYLGMNNLPSVKRAWGRYISRNPGPGVEKSTALQWLNTTGKNF